MKILVLMKRFGTNKDLVVQNFGRQIRLFEHIKNLGHGVDFLCMDYKKLESKKIRKNSINYFIEPFSLSKFNMFLKKLDFLLSRNKYDILVASTSPILGMIGYFYSRKYKTKFLYDLQDAFDIYDEYKIPFMRQIDRHVTKNADVVVCVSHALKKRITKFRKKPTYVVENGIERNLFKPMDRIKCRKMLNLPLDAKIIAYIGYMGKIRGFDVLLEAFEIVRKKFPDSHLLVSGQVSKDADINRGGIIFKTLPKRSQVAMAINSSDVAVIPNPANAFTEFCFPYKLLEYMACSAPIVATDVGDVGLLLRKYRGSLCKPNDAQDLAEKIAAKLQNSKRVNYSKELEGFSWKSLSGKLNKALNLKE